MKRILDLKLIRFAIVFVLLFFPIKAYTLGGYGGGISGIYNFQSSGIGIGLRGDASVFRRLTVVALIDYYPAFNTYNELYIGGEIIVPAIPIWQNWMIYPMAAGYYQMFFNHASFDSEQAKFSNLTYEAGIGLAVSNGAFRPFAEARYSIKWNEYIVRAGLIMYFGQKDKLHQRYQYYRKS
ncbi:MAG: hypothetical protein HRT71_08020 [Flavobacteriales bacterium]|nr:hypothetical protein [Flavobacteriales bacterium]